MPAQCNAGQLGFSCVDRRRVVTTFDGGTVSSHAGALLLGKADAAIGLIDRLAGCFIDGRDPDLIEHTVRTLIGQRVFGLALGYEDLNDHEQLRHDPVFGALLGKSVRKVSRVGLRARCHRQEAAQPLAQHLRNPTDSEPEPVRKNPAGYSAYARASAAKSGLKRQPADSLQLTLGQA